MLHNPHLPGIDDYYRPFDYDYQNLHTAPESKHQPIARPRSLITGQRMDKNYQRAKLEETAGGSKKRADQNFSLCEGDVRPVRKHLHDVPAAPV